MDCTKCAAKHCRSLNECPVVRVDGAATAAAYREPDTQSVVQAAARLVDGGRAGTLNRLEETAEFARSMGYRRLGLAYCYGLETLAANVAAYLRAQGLPVSPVSCTAGGVAQRDINETSELPGVSCNPLTQAEQLNQEGVDFAIVLGLCMGHDVLFTRTFAGDQTTLLVKDRPNGHDPGAGIREITP
jgi:uncharacterized metal-binding protein